MTVRDGAARQGRRSQDQGLLPSLLDGFFRPSRREDSLLHRERKVILHLHPLISARTNRYSQLLGHNSSVATAMELLRANWKLTWSTVSNHSSPNTPHSYTIVQSRLINNSLIVTAMPL